MGRAPCCEKMGLKKGSWTPEEDQILISYIRQHGHSNWRALPKQAGLLRCGKSCRLRWTNYLRPDIKRGNFTPDEEETIIKLHEMLGNRWSTIAARLPGRTDNEIKNVWHTHLKKRLSKPISDSITATTTGELAVEPRRKRLRKPKPKEAKKDMAGKKVKSEHVECMDAEEEENNNDDDNNNEDDDDLGVRISSSAISRDTVSPHSCTSEMSTVTNASENDNRGKENVGGKGDYFSNSTEINDDIWKEMLSVEDTAMSTEDFSYISQYDQKSSLDPLMTEPMFESSSMVNGDDMDYFWHSFLPELSEML